MQWFCRAIKLCITSVKIYAAIMGRVIFGHPGDLFFCNAGYRKATRLPLSHPFKNFFFFFRKLCFSIENTTKPINNMDKD